MKSKRDKVRAGRQGLLVVGVLTLSLIAAGPAAAQKKKKQDEELERSIAGGCDFRQSCGFARPTAPSRKHQFMLQR